MKRILSLDGGGIRGLFTLEVLARIEQLVREKTGNPKLVLYEEDPYDPYIKRYEATISAVMQEADMSFLGGNAQLFMYAAYVSIFAFVAWSREAGLSWRGLALRGGVTGMAALGLIAPGLIPAALFAASSTRAGVSYDFLSGGFPLSDIVSLVLPRVCRAWLARDRMLAEFSTTCRRPPT